MQKVKEGLEAIMRLTDDPAWSHVARMVKIKALAAETLLELKETPPPPRSVAKPNPTAAPLDRFVYGGKAGNNIQEQNKARAQQAPLQPLVQNPAGEPKRNA